MDVSWVLGSDDCPCLEALKIGQGSSLKFAFNFQCWMFGCQPHWSKQSGGVRRFLEPVP